MAERAKIDINRANRDELMQIEGIDGARADLIIEHRNRHGPFRSWQDVEAVEGLGEVLTDKAREQALIEGQPAARREQARAAEQPEQAEAQPITEEEMEAESELQDALLEALIALAQLDAEAAAAYASAAEFVEEDDVRRKLEEFRQDHRRHVRELNRVIESLGGEPFEEEVEPYESVLIHLVEAVGSMGTTATLLAVIGNEQLTNATYATALELSLDEEARRVVERNFEDEKRHLAWLIEARKHRPSTAEELRPQA